METPGPGHYNIGPKPWTKEYRKPIPIMCFISGSDLCSKCSIKLLGDYHKGKLFSWCHTCYMKEKKITTFLPKTEHVRHCSYYHLHIGIPNIICHTKTIKDLRRLELKEKVMFNKYGTTLDWN